MALPPRPHAAMSATPRRPPPMTRASASPSRLSTGPLCHTICESVNFHCDDEDVDDWIGQISHIACYANINDAFKWLHTLSLTDLAALQTWADWQVALRREFRKANYDISKSEQLRARRWRQGEAFSQYFADRRKLQKIVFGENAADQVLISDLLLGVPTNMHALINTSMGYPAGSTITIADFKRLIVDIEHSLGSQYGHLLSSPTAPPSNGLTFANPCTGHLYVEEDSSDEDEADESSDEDETGHTSENGSRADVHDDLDYEGSSACSEGAGADDLGHSDVDSRSEIVGSDGELDARSDDYHSMYDENEESA
ncbi:uncharacterized protein B0H18DRAFT_1120806 [Fomitopsis serialis]|uniref:uncharacterized protein n=1 Tax=Fomitopsis serialis TaxID=139415 RepID=UPI002008EB70|nr:uncharacterized protein B0H18DRAFT_1120806 [Neoantrodia serialis]KAH9922632.1 hypothetical protein B0H18DRAFT_1120806 [Neoantrodia serialis]